MKCLCLVCSDEETLHSLRDSPKDEKCLGYAVSLQNSGHLVAGEALESVHTAGTGHFIRTAPTVQMLPQFEDRANSGSATQAGRKRGRYSPPIEQ